MKKFNNISIPKRFNTVSFMVLVCLFFVSASVYAQADPTFNLKLILSIKDGDMRNALITITKNGAPYKIIDPDKSKYNVDLDLNAEYLFTFTKMGYITKSVVVDTHVPNDREKERFAKMNSEVILNKQPEDQVITYSQPVGRIKYDEAVGDFNFDNDYTATSQEMQKKAEAAPIPKPKPPAPNPKPVVTPLATTPPPPSKPIPVPVKEPEFKSEPPKPKVKEVVVTTPPKPVVKNREERIIVEDRRKITIVTINIDGVDIVYRKEEYNWGGIYYYRNGLNIIASTFDNDTN